MAKRKRGGKRHRLMLVNQSSSTLGTVHHTRPDRVIQQRNLLTGVFVGSRAILNDDNYDSEGNDESTSDGNTIQVRKRRLSATPESVRPCRSDMVEDLTDTESMEEGELKDLDVAIRTGRCSLGKSLAAVIPNPTRINVLLPDGSGRQITLDFDSGSITPYEKESSPTTTATYTIVKLQPASGLTHSTSKLSRMNESTAMPSAGLIGRLPPELRTIIYKFLFLYQGYLDIGRSAANHISGVAFLATCRLVHEEGRLILYCENTFRFARRTEHVGLLWSDGCRELGYIPFRTFTKMIGPINLSLLRALRLDLDDLRSSLTPRWNICERRFALDEILLSGLRELVRHGRLAAIRISFNGLKRLDNQPENHSFLNIMTQIKADKVLIQDIWDHGHTPSQTKDLKDFCLEAMIREPKLYKRDYEIAEWLPSCNG